MLIFVANILRTGDRGKGQEFLTSPLDLQKVRQFTMFILPDRGLGQSLLKLTFRFGKGRAIYRLGSKVQGEC